MSDGFRAGSTELWVGKRCIEKHLQAVYFQIKE